MKNQIRTLMYTLMLLGALALVLGACSAPAPTNAPPTAVPPTNAPPTAAPPTNAPAAEAPAANTAPAAADWQTYTVADCNYSVMVPGKVTEQNRTESSGTIRAFELKAGKDVYSGMCLPLPAGAAEKDLGAVLDAVLLQYSAGLGLQATQAQEITLGDWKGKQASGAVPGNTDFPGGGFVTLRVYMGKTHAYVFINGAGGSNELTADATKFLDSIQPGADSGSQSSAQPSADAAANPTAGSTASGIPLPARMEGAIVLPNSPELTQVVTPLAKAANFTESMYEAYQLPSATTWNDVTKFYSDQVTKIGWKSADIVANAQDMGGGNMIGSWANSTLKTGIMAIFKPGGEGRDFATLIVVVGK